MWPTARRNQVCSKRKRGAGQEKQYVCMGGLERISKLNTSILELVVHGVGAIDLALVAWFTIYYTPTKRK